MKRLFLIFSVALACLTPSAVTANTDVKTIQTTYYTITLPSAFRHKLKRPEQVDGKSVLIAFDNRFQKTGSIAIEVSPSDDIDIDQSLAKLKKQYQRRKGSVESLACGEQCRAYYGQLGNQRRNEHFVLLESQQLRVDIRYLAEDTMDSAKALILAIAEQIHTPLKPSS